jgi:hypothetical protein
MHGSKVRRPDGGQVHFAFGLAPGAARVLGAHDRAGALVIRDLLKGMER